MTDEVWSQRKNIGNLISVFKANYQAQAGYFCADMKYIQWNATKKVTVRYFFWYSKYLKSVHRKHLRILEESWKVYVGYFFKYPKYLVKYQMKTFRILKLIFWNESVVYYGYSKYLKLSDRTFFKIKTILKWKFCYCIRKTIQRILGVSEKVS